MSERAAADDATTKIPDALPVLPLRGGTVVYPLAVLPIIVGQPRSVRLVDEVMKGERLVALLAQKEDAPETPGPQDLHEIGTAGIIHQMVRGQDGSLRLLVQGLERVRVLDYTQAEPYLVARLEVEADQPADGVETEAMMRSALDLFGRLGTVMPELPQEVVIAAQSLTEPLQVTYLIASTASLPGGVRQEILALEPVDAKLRRLIEVMQHELSVRELGQRITEETRERMTKQQRDYFLREQLRSIQRELGEEESGSDVAGLRQRIEEAQLPDEARREAERELSRLTSIPEASPENGIIRTYLDWLASLPWQRVTGGDIDVARAHRVLDEDHYDLEKIKDRILEHLAVKKLRQERSNAAGPTQDGATPESNAREPILCFVGPPGVGKTSLGQSIARALGRKFVRISLGGVHDESEIRGHRRTYIGAMPGRIIQGIKRAETADPVFMLDEIDKVGSDWRGDPASALLEVLDPAQNSTFIDTYLGVPFDLSRVLFLTTANTLDTIPGPLLDRMEVLQLSGYTDQEKVAIARSYLVPKQLQAHGLTTAELTIEDAALLAIARGYTREAGVRNLDREVASACRKVAREIAEGRTEPVVVTAERVEQYLGRLRFVDEVRERTQKPGVATGLAWTPTGGDVLFVEATMMPSQEEKLLLTGMLGDVMRESAQAAVSFVRANLDMLGLPADSMDGKTVHIHVPAGAIPKDGPSAGVTMVTAVASMVTGRPVRNDLAMTGEITLRGKVLPVGGIREKVLAAHRLGIRTIILPRRNEADLQDVPADVRDDLTVIPVDEAEKVLEAALEHDTAPSRRVSRVGG
ncbi:MAG TPA: endopeptidase La [Dehalococcoidia bacterium]